MALEGNTLYFDWEVRLMEQLQAHVGAAGVSVLSFFSAFGEELLLILLIGFLYWCYDKKLGKTVGLTVLMGLVWAPELKNIVLRRRPYFDHEGIDILRPVKLDADIYDISAQGYSFPSGHSTNAVSLYGSIANGIRKKWMTILAVVLSLLVGISRVTVGAHYPTDVLAGWLLGLFSVFFVSFLQAKIEHLLLRYGILLLTAVPGLFYCKSEDYFTGFGLLVGFMLGTILEEKKVDFENTRSPIRMILRIAGGFAVYFVLNTLLKLPFSKEFLESGSSAALLVRAVRYAVISFVLFGVYPLIFQFFKKR